VFNIGDVTVRVLRVVMAEISSCASNHRHVVGLLRGTSVV
jgi:hypothetical protein